MPGKRALPAQQKLPTCGHVRYYPFDRFFEDFKRACSGGPASSAADTAAASTVFYDDTLGESGEPLRQPKKKKTRAARTGEGGGPAEDDDGAAAAAALLDFLLPQPPASKSASVGDGPAAYSVSRVLLQPEDAYDDLFERIPTLTPKIVARVCKLAAAPSSRAATEAPPSKKAKGAGKAKAQESALPEATLSEWALLPLLTLLDYFAEGVTLDASAASELATAHRTGLRNLFVNATRLFLLCAFPTARAAAGGSKGASAASSVDRAVAPQVSAVLQRALEAAHACSEPQEHSPDGTVALQACVDPGLYLAVFHEARAFALSFAALHSAGGTAALDGLAGLLCDPYARWLAASDDAGRRGKGLLGAAATDAGTKEVCHKEQKLLAVCETIASVVARTGAATAGAAAVAAAVAGGGGLVSLAFATDGVLAALHAAGGPAEDWGEAPRSGAQALGAHLFLVRAVEANNVPLLLHISGRRQFGCSLLALLPTVFEKNLCCYAGSVGGGSGGGSGTPQGNRRAVLEILSNLCGSVRNLDRMRLPSEDASGAASVLSWTAAIFAAHSLDADVLLACKALQGLRAIVESYVWPDEGTLKTAFENVGACLLCGSLRVRQAAAKTLPVLAGSNPFVLAGSLQQQQKEEVEKDGQSWGTLYDQAAENAVHLLEGYSVQPNVSDADQKSTLVHLCTFLSGYCAQRDAGGGGGGGDVVRRLLELPFDAACHAELTEVFVRRWLAGTGVCADASSVTERVAAAMKLLDECLDACGFEGGCGGPSTAALRLLEAFVRAARVSAATDGADGAQTLVRLCAELKNVSLLSHCVRVGGVAWAELDAASREAAEGLVAEAVQCLARVAVGGCGGGDGGDGPSFQLGGASLPSVVRVARGVLHVCGEVGGGLAAALLRSEALRVCLEAAPCETASFLARGRNRCVDGGDCDGGSDGDDSFPDPRAVFYPLLLARGTTGAACLAPLRASLQVSVGVWEDEAAAKWAAEYESLAQLQADADVTQRTARKATQRARRAAIDGADGEDGQQEEDENYLRHELVVRERRRFVARYCSLMLQTGFHAQYYQGAEGGGPAFLHLWADTAAGYAVVMRTLHLAPTAFVGLLIEQCLCYVGEGREALLGGSVSGTPNSGSFSFDTSYYHVGLLGQLLSVVCNDENAACLEGESLSPDDVASQIVDALCTVLASGADDTLEGGEGGAEESFVVQCLILCGTILMQRQVKELERLAGLVCGCCLCPSKLVSALATKFVRAYIESDPLPGTAAVNLFASVHTTSPSRLDVFQHLSQGLPDALLAVLSCSFTSFFCTALHDEGGRRHKVGGDASTHFTPVVLHCAELLTHLPATKQCVSMLHAAVKSWVAAKRSGDDDEASACLPSSVVGYLVRFCTRCDDSNAPPGGAPDSAKPAGDVAAPASSKRTALLEVLRGMERSPAQEGTSPVQPANGGPSGTTTGQPATGRKTGSANAPTGPCTAAAFEQAIVHLKEIRKVSETQLPVF